VTVLRRAYVPVLPELDGFDRELLEKLRAQDPGTKAGKQVGGQLNRALKRLQLDPIDIKADPKDALAKIEETQARLKRLAAQSPTVDVKVRIERGLAELARFKKQLGDTGDEAGKEFVSKFERDVGELGVVLDRLKLPSIDITADPDKALKSIAETEAALKRLSGDAATVEIRVDAEKARGDLQKIKQQISNDVGKDGAFGGFKLLSPQVLGTAIAAASPVIGAAISAAVIGGAGVGGVIGGLLLVKDDPRVQDAGAALANKLLGALKEDADPFVQPVLVAIAKIEGRFDVMEGRIKAIFSSSSGFLDPLVNGALDGVDKILAGIESLTTKGKPVMDALGGSFSILGDSIGKALSVIAGGGPEAASALTNIAKATGALIEGVAYLVRGLTELYGVISYIPGKFKELEVAAAGWVGINKDVGESTAAATASVIGQVQALARNAAASNAAAAASTSFVASQGDVKTAQDAAKLAQDAYNASLANLAPAGGRAAQVADGLRRAIDALHGAQVGATDANESYEASWDALSASIKENGRSLNIHTAAGRSNRDALEAVATATRDGYVADINAGVGIAEATKKHDARIAALKEEAKRSGLNKKATADLISTYGDIPKKKTTDLVLSGLQAVVAALEKLYIYQRSLATGKSIASVEQTLRTGSDNGPAKRGGGFADGGPVGGWSPHPKADNILARLTAKEWVHPVDAVDYYGHGIMGAIQHKRVPRELLAGFASGQLGKMGDLPLGLAGGGQVAPVDTSRLWKFVTTAARTRIPSRAEVASKVPLGGAAGPFLRAQDGKPYVWASAGPGGYDCSGIVSAVYNLLHGRNPYNHTFSTASLPGRWFTKGGIGGPLTAAWSNPGEAPASSTTGHMMGMVGGLTFESSGSRGVHLGKTTRRLTDFAHIAHYAQGGQVGRVPSFDSGGVLSPGLNTVFNGLGRPEPLVPAASGNTYQITVNVPATAHPAEVGRQVVGAIKAFEQGNGSRWRSGS
jgi:hypothetical protein